MTSVDRFVEPAHLPDIADLQRVDTRSEHRLASLAWPLLGGVESCGYWLQLQKNNVAATQDDESVYDTDWVLTADGHPVGYLDGEEKQRWHPPAEAWPWPRVNIAKFPMSHWKRGVFTGRPTNKLLTFRKYPALSWWLGVRSDYLAVMMVNAADLFEHGVERAQRTGYSQTPLPVYSLDPRHGRLVTDADAFTVTVVSTFEAIYAVR